MENQYGKKGNYRLKKPWSGFLEVDYPQRKLKRLVNSQKFCEVPTKIFTGFIYLFIELKLPWVPNLIHFLALRFWKSEAECLLCLLTDAYWHFRRNQGMWMPHIDLSRCCTTTFVSVFQIWSLHFLDLCSPSPMRHHCDAPHLTRAL